MLKTEKSEVMDEYKAFLTKMHVDSLNFEESDNDSDFVLDSDMNHTNSVAFGSTEEVGEEFPDDKNVAISSTISIEIFRSRNYQSF